MHKKITGLTLLCLFVFAFPILGHAVTVEIDGESLNLTPAPFIENGTTMVPMHTIFEALGADVVYEHETKIIIATKGSRGVALMIDYPRARIYPGFGQAMSIELSAPPKIINGTTFVPLRFVGEALNASVEWEAETERALINTKADDERGPITSEKIAELKNGILKDAEHKTLIGAKIYANANYDGWLTIDGPPANVKNLEPMQICNIWYQEYTYSASYGVKLKRNDGTYITLGDTALDPLPTIAHLGNYFHLVNPYETYQDWPESIWNSIKEQKVSVGMTKEQVLLAWGEPDDVNTTILSNLRSEQWVYGDPLYGAQYVYFDNDVVTALQE